MHITAAQMRAARGMLDWSRDELAQASGVSAGTIRNLEIGNLSPRENTTVRIRQAFEGAGISFLEGEGIRRERMDVKVIDGFDSCEAFFDTVLHTIKRKGGELLGVFKSQETMIKSFAEDNDLAFKRMESLGVHADIRCVLAGLEGTAMPIQQCKTRVAPKNSAGPSAYFVYGNRQALVHKDKQGDHKFIILNDIEIALSARECFCGLWETGEPLLASLNAEKMMERADARV